MSTQEAALWLLDYERFPNDTTAAASGAVTAYLTWQPWTWQWDSPGYRTELGKPVTALLRSAGIPPDEIPPWSEVRGKLESARQFVRLVLELRGFWPNDGPPFASWFEQRRFQALQTDSDDQSKY